MNVRIQYSARFMAGVWDDNALHMNEYTVKIYCMTNTLNTHDQNLALSRIKYFLFAEMEDTVFINSADVDQCQKLVDAGINITTMPGSPVDQLIGIMLYYKLGSIVEDKLIIGEIEISSAMSDNIVYYHSENENLSELVIPAWWESSDLAHCDDALLDTDKVVNLTRNSVWRDIDLAWDESEHELNETDEPTGNTVVFADFKKTDD